MATRQELEKALSNPNVRKMLDVIANAEGVKHGYNTIFGNERSDDLKAHPNVKKEFTQTDGKKNSTTAAGRYQFLKGTWDSVSKKYGLTDFSPKNQDLAAVALILGRGALGDVIKGDFTKAVGKLGGEWASLPSSPYAQPKKSWSDIKAMVGEIKPPNRKPAQNRINQLVTAYDKQAKASTTKNQINPQQKQSRVNSLLAAFDKQNPERQATPAGLPDFDENGVIREDQPQQPKPQQAPLSTMDKIIGGLEAGATLATGAVGGAIGQAAGGLHGIAESVVDGTFGTQQGAQNAVNRATQFSNALTYEPNTAGGRRAVGAVGEFVEDTGLDTLPPVLGGGVGTSAATLGRASVPVATTAAREVAQAAKPVVAQVVEQAKRPVAAVTEAAKNTFNRNSDAGGSMGAAAVPAAEVRQSLFNEFDVPATTAQVSRDQTELADMYNLARKGGEAGKVIQDTLDQQQARLASAIDDMIESKGARTINSEEVGGSIKDVLNTQYKVEHAAQNRAYEAVKNSEGAQTRVDIGNPPKWSKDYLKQEAEAGRTPDSNRSILDVINEESYLKTSKVYTDAKDLAVKLNIAQLNGDGNLVPMPKEKRPNIIQVEQLRQRIGEMGESTKKADGLAVQKLKALIDNTLDNSGSNAFKQARKNYAEFKQSWSNKAILKDLIDRKSRANSGDQKIINEKIIDRIVGGSTSQKDLEFVRNMVNKSEGGKDAWTDMQASILDKIRGEAFSGAADSSGNGTLVFNKMDKVIKRLDGATRRLDTLLGHEQAQKVRDANDLARIIQTVPPNTGVNWSNTMTALAAAVDGIIFGISGMPATFATALRFALKYIHEKKDVAKAHSIIRRAEKPKGGSGKF
ncbi:glycoside hydrolase family 104 protein [Acinetobacter lwoffii]|uniref:glycoside hydrolase family 24 protein n=1 Tax=Acinetobacter lwoffii TaxID=28090 RepID=UPI001FB4B0EA|nr:glycoside hydrolase family 104 protein [Acinetobacter lwoffii]MCJ0927927.1 glycoside hydrolase family 104 protein [Acinetobacter lwoffii]